MTSRLEQSKGKSHAEHPIDCCLPLWEISTNSTFRILNYRISKISPISRYFVHLASFGASNFPYPWPHSCVSTRPVAWTSESYCSRQAFLRQVDPTLSTSTRQEHDPSVGTCIRANPSYSAWTILMPPVIIPCRILLDLALFEAKSVHQRSNLPS